MIRHYLMEMFEPTLLYGFALALLGVAAAYHYGHFLFSYAILVIIGTVLAQMSVNVISDYFDYKSGLDRELVKKKSGNLAGGSSLMAKGLIKPGRTLALGLSTLSIAALIGIYLLYTRIQILPIMVIAAFSIFLYAKYVKRIPYLSEPVCSLNYVLVTFGSFIVVAGASSLTYALVFSFIPAGIMLGGNALFVNEVPDRVVDKKYGVRHSAVMLKTNQKIGIYYLGIQLICFAIIAIGTAAKAIPILAAACFLALPATYYVFKGLYEGDSKNYGRYLQTHTIASVVLALILCAAYSTGI